MTPIRTALRRSVPRRCMAVAGLEWLRPTHGRARRTDDRDADLRRRPVPVGHDLYRPAGESRGVVVVIHGGFWKAEYDASLGEPLAADLAARGWTALEPGVPPGRQRRRAARRPSTTSPPASTGSPTSTGLDLVHGGHARVTPPAGTSPPGPRPAAGSSGGAPSGCRSPGSSPRPASSTSPPRPPTGPRRRRRRGVPRRAARPGVRRGRPAPAAAARRAGVVRARPRRRRRAAQPVRRTTCAAAARPGPRPSWSRSTATTSSVIDPASDGVGTATVDDPRTGLLSAGRGTHVRHVSPAAAHHRHAVRCAAAGAPSTSSSGSRSPGTSPATS